MSLEIAMKKKMGKVRALESDLSLYSPKVKIHELFTLRQITYRPPLPSICVSTYTVLMII